MRRIPRSLELNRLRYYPPEKQGLRQRPVHCYKRTGFLRYYPPEKQGLRLNFSYRYFF